MSETGSRWIGWSLLLGLVICNETRAQVSKTPMTSGAAPSNARMLAADEAAAMEELQRLAVTDPTRIHATRLWTHNRMGWKWRVYLPPGKDWTIHAAIGRIPGRGRQPQQRDIVSCEIRRHDQSRIIALEGHISRAPLEDWNLTIEADRRIFSTSEFATWGLHTSPDREEVADYIIGRRNASSLSRFSGDIGRVTTTINHELELVRWRYEPGTAPPPPGPDRRLPGFVIWIEGR